MVGCERKLVVMLLEVLVGRLTVLPGQIVQPAGEILPLRTVNFEVQLQSEVVVLDVEVVVE